MLIEIEHGDEVCVVRLSGDFASGEDPAYVRDKSAEVRSHDCKKMLADCSQLRSIGSMGIGFVVGVYIYVAKRSAGGSFILAGANKRVRDVLDLTLLSTIIPLAVDPRSGLAALLSADPTARSLGKA